MKKTALTLALILASAAAQAVVITWNVNGSNNPQGQTLNNVTLGTISKIIVVDGGSAASVTTDTYRNGNMTQVYSASASFNDDLGVLTTKDGFATTTLASVDTTHNYFILVVDGNGNFFSSNALKPYTTDGWDNVPTDVTSPKNPWTPNYYYYDNEKHAIIAANPTDDGWFASGTVPEPTGFALILLGAGCLALRRRAAQA